MHFKRKIWRTFIRIKITDRDKVILVLIAFMCLMQFKIFVLEQMLTVNTEKVKYFEDLITNGIDINVSIELISNE